jgi:hypothetical protein
MQQELEEISGWLALTPARFGLDKRAEMGA